MNNDAMSFAANLRRLRKEAKLTQEGLALACGYSGQSRISNYEREGPDGREPELSEIPVIAKALGVEIAQLFGQPASGQGSQSVRLDPAMLAETSKALRVHFERQGVSYRIEDDPDTFITSYVWRQELGPSRLIEFVDRLNELTPQGADEDGRREGVPDAGTAKGAAGRH